MTEGEYTARLDQNILMIVHDFEIKVHGERRRYTLIPKVIANIVTKEKMIVKNRNPMVSECYV